MLSGLKLKLPGGTLVTTPTAEEASVFAHFSFLGVPLASVFLFFVFVFFFILHGTY